MESCAAAHGLCDLTMVAKCTIFVSDAKEVPLTCLLIAPEQQS